MRTLPSRIDAAAHLGGKLTFIQGDTATPVSWAEIHEDAKKVAAGLQARGVRPR